MVKTAKVSRSVPVRAAFAVCLAAFSMGCAVTTGDGSEEPTPDDTGLVDVGGKGDSAASGGSGVVVDCSAAKDSVSVRTCKLGSSDQCTVQATVQATQVVKNSAVVKTIGGSLGTHNGQSIYRLNLAEAKLLANLHHMKLLLSSAGGLTSTAYEYTKDGAPFVYSQPIPGMSVVTKTSANGAITRIQAALKASASTCTQFRVASTDGITPVDTSFICEKTASDTLLFCDGTVPAGLDYAVGPSTIVNGVEIIFSKVACGAFTYELTNKGDSAVSVQSKISGVALQPSCNFGVAANGGTGYCDATGIAGPTTLTFSGSVKRGTTTSTFSLPVMMRCSSL